MGLSLKKSVRRQYGENDFASCLDAPTPCESGSLTDGTSFPLAVNEMKSASLPLTGAAIMPSPALLWRFKHYLFLNITPMRSALKYESIDDKDYWSYWIGLLLGLFPEARGLGGNAPHGPQPPPGRRVILYAAVLMVIIFPFDIFYLSSRYYLLKTLWRIMFPLQAITFADFFVADILTSMSKDGINTSWTEGSFTFKIIMTERCFQIWSVQYVEWLINSVFSRIFKFKNPHLCSTILYGRQWIYYWAILSNLTLRCTWTYKLSAHLRHNYITVFTIMALEIFRRFQWIFFRVENEWNKIALKPSLQVAMSEVPKEEERLLGSDSHNTILTLSSSTTSRVNVLPNDVGVLCKCFEH
ncbi:hypothetical protein QJS04_geneDACA023781 [Acorus gramineus]|uniref:EXS domain-containing protein n=1 Tax=Acorus gramineus TaxID=55184 RepID=A0AAV9A8B9_ACOGR|nr:hypothetical protein QJS04_geneDACA023781 [Acorus gramineus]